MRIADHLGQIDILATSDHKFLLNAGRGMGYCYIAPSMQDRFTPINAGWKAGQVPVDSFFGPNMVLSSTASRFDNSISWLAAIGNEVALSVFDDFGQDVIYVRNHQLATVLRLALSEAGWESVNLAERNRSTIIAVPFGECDPAVLLAALDERKIRCAARDGNLRLAVHFYNHEDDIPALVAALTEIGQ